MVSAPAGNPLRPAMVIRKMVIRKRMRPCSPTKGQLIDISIGRDRSGYG
jgi:hypothetical protein